MTSMMSQNAAASDIKHKQQIPGLSPSSTAAMMSDTSTKLTQNGFYYFQACCRTRQSPAKIWKRR